MHNSFVKGRLFFVEVDARPVGEHNLCVPVVVAAHDFPIAYDALTTVEPRRLHAAISEISRALDLPCVILCNRLEGLRAGDCSMILRLSNCPESPHGRA